MYTCFLDGEPAWSCECLSTLISHIQEKLDNSLIAAIGNENIFQGKGLHCGKSYTIEIRNTSQEESS